MFGKNSQAGKAAAGAAGNPAQTSRSGIRNLKNETRNKFRSQVFDIPRPESGLGRGGTQGLQPAARRRRLKAAAEPAS
jgi:hypothetical protein